MQYLEKQFNKKRFDDEVRESIMQSVVSMNEYAQFKPKPDGLIEEAFTVVIVYLGEKVFNKELDYFY